MKLSTPLVILLGSIIIAAAITFGARSPSYELVGIDGGLAVRLDTRSGQTVVRVPQRTADGSYIAPCTGRRE